jgi:hypothetical protein
MTGIPSCKHHKTLSLFTRQAPTNWLHCTAASGPSSQIPTSFRGGQHLLKDSFTELTALLSACESVAATPSAQSRDRLVTHDVC